jgi:hypothetical protein
MPRNGIGFGQDSFGRAPFGEAWWSRRILWENIPEFDKQLDAESGGALEKFLSTMGDMLNAPRRKIRLLDEVRDARRAQTRWSDPIVITSASFTEFTAEDAPDGMAYVQMLVTDGSTFKSVGPEWTVDNGTIQFSIRSIEKVDNYITFYAPAAPALPVTLRPPDLLQHLGADYGVVFDGHEPELNQRSSVYDHHKLLDLKGSKEGILVRARMAGFEATVYSLFRVESASVAAIVGSDRFFEIPSGSGRYYTDVAPTVTLFDAIPADVLPTDLIASCDSTAIAGTVTGSTGSAGAWDVALSTSIEHATSQFWYFTYDADTSEDPTRYYVNPSMSVGAGHVGIASETQPIAGAVTWKFYCPVVTSCEWCKSHRVRVELEVVDPALLASPRALELAFQRMSAKISQMLPAHVTVVQYVFTSASEASAGFSAGVESTTLQFELFDVDAADVHEVDLFTITSH